MPNQNFDKKYIMCSLTDRQSILSRIASGELVSECQNGRKYNWWLNKHNPLAQIPTRIYHLGSNYTIREYYQLYLVQYCINITWEEFINYTRELIKQKIMI